MQPAFEKAGTNLSRARGAPAAEGAAHAVPRAGPRQQGRSGEKAAASETRRFQKRNDRSQCGEDRSKPTSHRLYLTCVTPGDIVCPRRKGLADLAMLRADRPVVGASVTVPASHTRPTGALRERGPHPPHAQTMPGPRRLTMTQAVGTVSCVP